MFISSRIILSIVLSSVIITLLREEKVSPVSKTTTTTTLKIERRPIIFNTSYYDWADKWFPDVSDHYDKRYYSDDVSNEKRLRILGRLFNDMHTVFTSIYNITYWLDAGSLLGCYRNNRIIPWDTDGDIGVLRSDLYQLPLKSFHMKHNNTLLEINPNFVYELKQNKNQVDGRIIDTNTGVYIDIFAFVTRNNSKNERYLVSKWFDGYMHEEFGFLAHKYSSVYPIQKCILQNVTLYCPNDSKTYLMDIYASLEPPPSSTDIYSEQ